MTEYLLTILVAAAITYLLTPLVRRFATVAGAISAIRERDVHAVPTPRLGGMAMFCGLCSALVVADQLPHLRSVFANTTVAPALLSGCGLICLLGVIDDRWGMDSLIKLAGQVIAAAVMVGQGIQITWLPVPGVGTLVLDPTSGFVLSVLVVVATINAMNFVDGLDGLAAGIAAIAGVTFFLFCYRLWVGYGVESVAAPTLVTAVLIGICVGFLPHNLHPARIFMGDSGAMLIGLVLAAGAISLVGQVDPVGLGGHASQSFITRKLAGVYVPGILLIAVILVPFTDMLLAVVRRVKAGRSPFAADKRHLHHRLMAIGHSHGRAVLLMYFWAAFVAFVTLLVSVRPQRRPVLLVGAVLLVLGIGALMAPRLPRWLRRPAREMATVAHVMVQPADGDGPPTANPGGTRPVVPTSADVSAPGRSGHRGGGGGGGPAGPPPVAERAGAHPVARAGADRR